MAASAHQQRQAAPDGTYNQQQHDPARRSNNTIQTLASTVQQSLHNRPNHSSTAATHSNGHSLKHGKDEVNGSSQQGPNLGDIAASGLHNLATGVQAYSQHAKGQTNGTTQHSGNGKQSLKRAGSRAAQQPSLSSSGTAAKSITSYITIVTELVFMLLEFICGLTLIKYCLYTAVAALSPQASLGEDLMVQLAINTVSNLSILAWCLMRFAHRINSTPIQLLHSLGATDISINRLTLVVIALHTLGFAIMFTIDSASNGTQLKYFSMANYMIPTEASELGLDLGEVIDTIVDSSVSAPVTGGGGNSSKWNVVQVLDMLVFAPIREEIVFRGIALTYLLSRLANDRSSVPSRAANDGNKHNVISTVIHAVTSMNDDTIKSQQISAAFYNGLAFGLIHILNLFTAKTNYSATYCALQIILGTTVGWFYSLHIILYDSLFQVICMHIANNLYSSFLPLDLAITMDDPILVCSLASTVIVYISLTVITVQAIRDRPYKQVTALSKQKVV